MSSVKLVLGDCLEVMRDMPDNSISAVVADPPYGLSFMGKKWDYDVPSVAIWRECLRVLKPGGHLLAFAGTRTQHRMAVNIEDAGFEIRDMIAWVYGSGFPKGKRLDESASHHYQSGDLCQCAANTRSSVNTYHVQHVLDRICTVATWGAMEHDLLPNDHCGLSKSQDYQGDYPSLSHSCDGLLRQVAAHVLASVQPQEYAQGHNRFDVRVDGLEGESLHSLFRVLCSDLPTMLDYFRPSALPHVEQLLRVYGDERCHEADLHTLLSSMADSLDVSKLMDADTLGRHKPHIYSWVFCFPLPILRMLSDRNYESIIPQMEMCCNCNGLLNKWSGWNVALKPALEPITVARKPFTGTVAANVLEHGTGGLNIDACRVEITDGAMMARHNKPGSNGWKNSSGGPNGAALNGEPTGRWPANLIHDGSEEVTALFPQRHGGGNPDGKGRRSKNCTGDLTGMYDGGWREMIGQPAYTDTGSAARFFYCAKASKRDRDEGLGGKNLHPTVKPTDLMRYLCRLITPPNGVILDPFMGSGSTGTAAILEGFGFVGIELEPEYLEIAERRIAQAQAQPPLIPHEAVPQPVKNGLLELAE